MIFNQCSKQISKKMYFYLHKFHKCTVKYILTKTILTEAVMKITDIKVRKLFDDGPMKAVVSVTFDDQLAVHDIKVINAKDKFFIVMPSRKNPDNTYRDIVHPINSSFRLDLEEAVIDAYNRELALAQVNANEEIVQA